MTMIRSDRGPNPVTITAWTVGIVLIAVIIVFSVKRFNYCVPQDVAWLKNTPVAHRGLHDSTRDENSLGAFANAISHGYAVELDVRLTKDGVPVVIHDSKLSRTFGIDDLVSKTLLTDLKKLKLPKSGEEIPTLSEAVAFIDGRVPILIDMKNFGRPGKFEMKVLSVLEGYQGEYALQAFNPFVCRWLRKHNEDLVVGLLLDDIPYLRFRGFRNFKDNLFSAIASPGFIGYNYNTVTDEVAQAYRANGVTVLGYGLLQEALNDSAYRQYVDNIIFDISHP